VETSLEEVPGVDTAMPVWRGLARLGHDRSEGSLFDILAVVPGAVMGMVDWRDDFATSPPSELLQSITASGVTPGLVLPGEPDGIAMDVNSSARPSATLWVRLRDADGTAYQV